LSDQRLGGAWANLSRASICEAAGRRGDDDDDDDGHDDYDNVRRRAQLLQQPFARQSMPIAVLVKFIHYA